MKTGPKEYLKFQKTKEHEFFLRTKLDHPMAIDDDDNEGINEETYVYLNRNALRERRKSQLSSRKNWKSFFE